MKFMDMTDKAVMTELADRIRRERLNRNITQKDLWERAGVSKKVIQQLETGNGCTLDSLIKILRALGRLDQLDAFLPDPGISPIQLARMAGRQRRRASGSRGAVERK
ncbi:helix-turn-helix transcriptional regulator [bacterium]|nr:helix-turn-helix transcriptional regulator [bacterium]